MDVCESEQVLRKHRVAETQRPPLVPAERNNEVVTTRRPQTREISSRYKSPSRATPSSPRRCPSPNPTRTMSTSSKLLPKRAQSAERKRPSTPPSPPSPSTPVYESSVDVPLPSRRTTSSRLQESLWPSTMRSLSVSFQSDAISIPVSKKEKPNTSASDRTLRPTSNVAHKNAETPTLRKPTPERMKSPLKGKSACDHSENSKPVDGLHSRLIDQHRWPSSTCGKVSSNVTNRSSDISDKAIRTLNSSVPRIGLSSLRRLSISDEASKPLQKSISDTVRNLSMVESGKIGNEVKSVNDSLLQVLRPHKIVSASPSVKIATATPTVRSQSLPTPGPRPLSPIKTSVPSLSSARGISPSRSRPSTPPSRGLSPSRIRATNLFSQPNSTTTVLSFIADLKKGKKGHIDDAHQLRLLYNRYLQWRFANARAEAVLYIQNTAAEKALYNVWNATLSLWDSVIRKRINLHQLKLELKLNSVLNDQIAHLDDWALLERDHVDALSGAIEDLEANTLRLPVIGSAKADIEHLKVAICSAVDVMQAMGSAICSMLSRVEGMSHLVSELAAVAAEEKAMLDECEVLLASAVAMQVEENSLRTHIIQIKQALGNEDG